MTNPDWHPQVFFRLWPKPADCDAFDEWQRERHGARLVNAPGAVMFGYFAAADGLPDLYRSGVSRMDFYTASNLTDLRKWMSSDELQEELADGARWIRKLHEVDGEPFSANVYEVTAVHGAGRAVEAPILVERFEVPPGRKGDEFDRWLNDVHGRAIAGHPDVTNVRTFRAVRDDIPVRAYCSAGNRMLQAEMDPERFRDAFLSDEFLSAVEDSTHWGQRLEYFTRDVFVHAFHYHSRSAPRCKTPVRAPQHRRARRIQ